MRIPPASTLYVVAVTATVATLVLPVRSPTPQPVSPVRSPAPETPECDPSGLYSGGCLILEPDDIAYVYDGDTITIHVSEWPPIVRIISIRLTGYDTPEIRGKCEEERRLARVARDELRKLLSEAESIRLSNIDRGKYFRLIGNLEIDGLSVRKLFVSAGLARPYDGGTRLPWCSYPSEAE